MNRRPFGRSGIEESKIVRATPFSLSHATRLRFIAALIFIAGLCCVSGTARAQQKNMSLSITELTTEYRTNPLAVDAAMPRFGWILSSARRGAKQTAYQILVAGSEKALAADRGELWDSGKTLSSQSFGVAYGGPALASGQRAFWKVRVWDGSGAASAWSEAAYWQAAPRAADWSARWITPAGSVDDWREYDVEADFRILRKQVGVAFRAQDSHNLYMWQFSVDTGRPRLRRHLSVDGEWQVREADLPATALPAVARDGGQFGTDWHRLKIEVRAGGARTFIDGTRVDDAPWSLFPQALPSGTVGFRSGDANEEGAFKNLRVTDADGKALFADDLAGENRFSAGRVDAANKHLLVAGGELALRKGDTETQWRSPLFRKEFVAKRKVARATAHVFALGWYELYLNGVKADKRVLAPALTPYERRRLYDTYDVTARLQAGGNAVGLWLGDGYRLGKYSKWGWKWDGLPGAMLQMEIVYEDGTTERIVTDEGWKCAPSAIAFNHIYDGETYDARRERADWAGVGASGDWQPVRASAADYAKLSPNPAPPIEVTKVLRPVAVHETAPGVFVFDMGQNFAGWVRLRAKGAAGTAVRLRHSENIDPATKSIDPWTNRNAKATDTYILRGGGAETYEPRFTYHGFRYVEVTGYPGTPTLDDVSGCVVHSAAETTGRFHTSDALLNRIQSNLRWGIASNLMSVPTDCPQRDERTPCQMDSAAYEEAAIHNFGLHGYYAKWLGDIRGDTGNPDWSGDQVTLCWHLYQLYGDRDILAQHYDGLKRYIDSHRRRVSDLTDANYLFQKGFGDWCAPNPDGAYQNSFSSVRETNVALYYRHLTVFSEIARLLGKTGDAAEYAALAAQVKDVYNREFWKEAPGQYGDGRQTTALLPLAFGMVPDARRPRLVENLLRNIRVEKQGHLDTGIYGTRFFLDVLSDLGHVDTAMAALGQRTYPGFGFQIAQGATTLWEQWHVKGGMQSHNHAMFSGIGASFYTRLAGITPAAPGYTEIAIRPTLPRDLAFVEASLKTVSGTVESNWRVEGDRFHLKVTIPANTSAEVHLPARAPSAVAEGGKPLSGSKEIRVVGQRDDHLVLAIGAGTYDFTVEGVEAR